MIFLAIALSILVLAILCFSGAMKGKCFGPFNDTSLGLLAFLLFGVDMGLILYHLSF